MIIDIDDEKITNSLWYQVILQELLMKFLLRNRKLPTEVPVRGFRETLIIRPYDVSVLWKKPLSVYKRWYKK